MSPTYPKVYIGQDGRVWIHRAARGPFQVVDRDGQVTERFASELELSERFHPDEADYHDGCLNDTDVDRARDDGYDDGHADGLNEGRAKASKAAYDKGWDEGLKAGFDEGYSHGTKQCAERDHAPLGGA